ncbi:MAG: hypothetical protein NW201_13760 [Gemmatimonadales bacterium]|nr:hypothetical protein [Gemmatimonadales bacterium]
MPRSPAVLLLALLALACDPSRDVTVRVALPDAAERVLPAPGIAVVALPYDRDSLIRRLEAAATTPRPATAVADSLFAAFRTPFASVARVSYEVRALEDSARASADAALAQRLAAARARLAAAQAALATARTRLAGADSLRAALRRWEDITYKGWDSLVKQAAGRYTAVTDTTDATGVARLHLLPGRWWLYARSFDAADPNREWYWNVPLPAQGDTVVLDPSSGARRPRY